MACDRWRVAVLTPDLLDHHMPLSHQRSSSAMHWLDRDTFFLSIRIDYSSRTTPRATRHQPSAILTIKYRNQWRKREGWRNFPTSPRNPIPDRPRGRPQFMFPLPIALIDPVLVPSLIYIEDPAFPISFVERLTLSSAVRLRGEPRSLSYFTSYPHPVPSSCDQDGRERFWH